jgi:hypothetical protein
MSARLLLRLLVLGCACPSLAACRTRLLVSDITDVAETPRAELIDGIPFRVRETHTIHVFQYQRLAPTKDEDGKPVYPPGCFRPIYRTEVPFPNLCRVFALNFRAEGFADHDFDLAYYPDNTLRKVTLMSRPNAEGLGELQAQADTFAKSALTLEEQVLKREAALAEELAKREKAEQADLTDLLDYQAKREALKGACAAWKRKTNPTAEEHTAAQDALRNLLKDLMLAAFKIGRRLIVDDPYRLTLEEICERFGT